MRNRINNEINARGGIQNIECFIYNKKLFKINLITSFIILIIWYFENF